MQLRTALSYVERIPDARAGAGRIDEAVRGLDEAINLIRGVAFDRSRRGPGVGALIVEGVERACAQGWGECPTITLGYGVDLVADEACGRRLARLVHRLLCGMSADRLAQTRVDVIGDPRPPARLVVGIEAPGPDLVAGLAALDDGEVEVSCQAVGTSPPRSRVLLEYRVGPPDRPDL